MNKIREIIKNKYIYFFITIFILILFQVGNGTFCDESDVITSSWLISEKWILYKDIFTHHMPFPYYFMSIFNLFGKNVIILRVSFAVCLFIYFIFIYNSFKNKIEKLVLCIFFVIYALSMPYFSGQMMLADSFFAVAITTIFLIVFTNSEFNFSVKEQITISAMTFIACTSTLIAVYPLVFFYIYYIGIRLNIYRKDKLHIIKHVKKDMFFVLLVLIPFLVWILYMVFTKSFIDFIEYGIKFNTDYYSKYTGNDTPRTLITNHIKNFSPTILASFESIIAMIKSAKFDVNLIFPAFARISFMIFCIQLFFKKECRMGIFVTVFIYFSYMRGDAAHGVPFYMPTLLIFSYLLVKLVKSMQFKEERKNVNTVYLAMSIIIILVLVGNYTKMIFPLRNDFKKTAKDEIVELVTDKNDRIWQAPLNPLMYFTTQRLPADRSIVYLPWLSDVPGKNEEIIKNLMENSPKVIAFESDVDIWGYPIKKYGEKIIDFINENYFNIPTIDKDLYFNNKYKDEILNILSKNNFDVFNKGYSQEYNEDNLGNIINSTVTQEIACDQDNLVEIELLVATFCKENQSGTINIKLYNDENTLLAKEQYDLMSIKDNSSLKLKFDPIKDSKNKKYKLDISSESNKKDAALTLYSSKSDVIQNLNLSLNDTLITKDLVFKTYYKY